MNWWVSYHYRYYQSQSKEALQALTGINRKHKKNYFEDNPEVDDFKL